MSTLAPFYPVSDCPPSFLRKPRAELLSPAGDDGDLAADLPSLELLHGGRRNQVTPESFWFRVPTLRRGRGRGCPVSRPMVGWRDRMRSYCGMRSTVPALVLPVEVLERRLSLPSAVVAD